MRMSQVVAIRVAAVLGQEGLAVDVAYMKPAFP